MDETHESFWAVGSIGIVSDIPITEVVRHGLLEVSTEGSLVVVDDHPLVALQI
jgi:hypothetical protein